MFSKRNKKIFSNLSICFLFLGIIALPFAVNAATPTDIGTPACDGLNGINPACWLGALWSKFVGGLSEMVLSLTSLVTWAAGTLLDVVIKITIVNMSSNIGAISGINTAWQAMRDLANIFFIFILLYAAIATVLQLGGVGTKKIITRVIIIALLLNFSLFFTRVIIDVSNSLSVVFYNSIVGQVPIGTSGDPSISGRYMDTLLLTTLYKADGSGQPAVDLAQYPAVGFLGGVFFLVTAFVFLAAAVLFISRYVVLIFLMILSAPAFAAMALPNGKYDFSGKWWEALWSQVIFAPAFFILSWVTLQVLDGVVDVVASNGAMNLAQAIRGSVDNAGNQTADAGAVNVFANFGIAITFMIASLTIAKTLAGSAGKGIQNFVGGVVGGATVGAAAWAGRRFIGGAAQRTLEDAELNRKALRGDAGARLQLQAAKRLSKSSFDIRATGAGKNLGLGKAGGKGGYAAYEKAETKQEADFAKNAVASDNEIFMAQQKREREVRKDLSAKGGDIKTPEVEALEKEIAQTTKDLKVENYRNAGGDMNEWDSVKASSQKRLEGLQARRFELGKEAYEKEVSRVMEKEGKKIQDKIEAEGKAKRKEAVESIKKQWYSQTRVTRLSTARKALKEKSKGQKAIEDYIKELDEEKSKEKKEGKDEGGGEKKEE